jgi:hypothetical protein
VRRARTTKPGTIAPGSVEQNSIKLQVDLATQYARETQDASTQHHHAAGLRSRAAVDGEGFPSKSTSALRDTTYRELANCGAVIYVPRVNLVGSAVIGISQGEPVGAAGRQASGETGHMGVINVVTVAVGQEVRVADLSCRAAAYVAAESRSAQPPRNSRRGGASGYPHTEVQAVRGAAGGRNEPVGNALAIRAGVRAVNENRIYGAIGWAVGVDYAGKGGSGQCQAKKYERQSEQFHGVPFASCKQLELRNAKHGDQESEKRDHKFGSLR